MLKTAEFVSPKHPDKLCDQISDAILDAYLSIDPNSRVAVETVGAHGRVWVAGEVTSKAREIDISKIVKNIAEQDLEVTVNIVEQSPEIARGVDDGGAGDQGIMIGYATRETDTFMPREYELARRLCKKVYEFYPYDVKTQVTINAKTGELETVVCSFQNAPKKGLEELVREIMPDAKNYHINPAGDWQIGGFDADSGLTGRKIMVDNYGPEIAVGGGAFSGKDPSKVDRSAAYMARRIAVDILKNNPDAQKVLVKLAYAIGHPEAVMATALIDGVETKIENYDITPIGIRNFLELDKPIYQKTAAWGHFGRDFAWG